MKSIFKRKWRVSTRWTIYVNGNIWLIYPQTSSKQAIQIEILWNALYCIANTTFDRVKAYSILPTINYYWSLKQKEKKRIWFFFRICNTLIAKWHILLCSLCSLFTNERFAQNNLLNLIYKKRSMPWSKSTQKSRAFIT